jgi:hypothetical protein
VGWWDRDSRRAQQTLELCFACGREVWSLGGLVNEKQDMVGYTSRLFGLVGWMDGWIDDYSIAIVDAYKASIAIRIMSDER